MMAIMAVFGFLLVNLVIFHIYLIYKNTTTYEFLREQKANEIAE